MSDIILRVENLSKEYRLGLIGRHTLRQDLESWWCRLRGKEDPNSLLSLPEEFQNRALHAGGKKFWALRDISFTLESGKVLGIIGRNGSGKSTLLKIISRITSPTKGSVRSKGRLASLLEVGTGFHPELTGRENVFLNGAILGMTKTEIKRRFDEILDFSGIEAFIDTPVKRYSSGMYVRLAFAVAAHLASEILIVDEVLAVGDVVFQKKCLAKMDAITGKEGRTVLFVSHNMDMLRSLCERVLLIEQGELGLDGKTSEVLSQYLLQLEERDLAYRIDSDDFHSASTIGIWRNNGMRAGTGEIQFQWGNFFSKDGIEKREFTYEDDFSFRFTISSFLIEAHDICLRIIISERERAMEFSSDEHRIELIRKGEKRNFELRFLGKELLPGKYSLHLSLYPYGRDGQQRDYDVIRRLKFDILSENLSLKPVDYVPKACIGYMRLSTELVPEI